MRKTCAGWLARARSISRSRPRDHERLEACRRHAQQLVGAAEISQREVAEERVAVRANGGVGRHEHEVRVELGGLLVEVARSQAGDAADAGVVMVGNLADLRVALEALGAVDYGAAGILQALCPGDVVLLVKAGAQLHEDGDVLACLGGGYDGPRRGGCSLPRGRA